MKKLNKQQLIKRLEQFSRSLKSESNGCLDQSKDMSLPKKLRDEFYIQHLCDKHTMEDLNNIINSAK